MKLPRRRFLHLAAGATALPAISRIAQAQTKYPSRAITMIVPFAVGGPLDVVGRIMAEAMRGPLGQPVVIENVAGAGGSIGVGRLARATPDGYTIGIGNNGTNVFNGAMYALPYDLANDLQPVALLASSPQLIVARRTMPANDLDGLVAWLKANQDKASQGTSGVGSVGHIASVFFQNATGTRLQYVPYRGLAPAMQGLLAGEVDMMIDLPANSLPQLSAGNIKAYAVTAANRLPLAPAIPTVDEAGLPGLYAPVWYAISAPKGTPKDVIAKLSSAVVAASADPNVRARIADLDFVMYPSDQQTPEALGAYQRAEINKWWPIIKAAGVKGE
jgi:tripartite-type tricarboxylate transporter receptor subunit TctC